MAFQQPFKVCPRCGQRSVLNALACGRCGTSYVQPPPWQQGQYVPRKGIHPFLWGVIGCCCTPVIILVVLFVIGSLIPTHRNSSAFSKMMIIMFPPGTPAQTVMNRAGMPYSRSPWIQDQRVEFWEYHVDGHFCVISMMNGRVSMIEGD